MTYSNWATCAEDRNEALTSLRLNPRDALSRMAGGAYPYKSPRRLHQLSATVPHGIHRLVQMEDERANEVDPIGWTGIGVT